MIAIIIIAVCLFILYQNGILKFGSSENTVGSFIPFNSDVKVVPYKSPHVNSRTYKPNPYGIEGRWAEVIYKEIPPEMKLKNDQVKENNRLYNEEEKIINALRKEDARNMCEQILSIISTSPANNYKTSHSTDGVRYGNRLKSYTEFGVLGYFTYLILDDKDVSDAIDRFFSISALLSSHQIVEI